MSREKAITQSQPNTIEVSRPGEMTQTTPRNPVQAWAYRPDADIIEFADFYQIALDVPGVSRERLDVTVENNTLRVHGRIDRQREQIDGRFVRQEYGLGDYVRQFTFNETVDAEQIAAECRGGVLTVRLPKHETTRPRHIPVNTGSTNGK